MKVPSVINFYVKKIRNLNASSYRDVCKYLLEELKFKKVGSGCEAVAFTRKGFEYVIKVVYSNHTGNSIKLLRNNPNPKHFVEGWSFEVNDNYYLVFQKKVEDPQNINWRNKQYQRLTKFLKKKYPSVADTCEFNCGYINGRMVVFDWTDTSINH